MALVQWRFFAFDHMDQSPNSIASPATDRHHVWRRLHALARDPARRQLRQLFAEDPQRPARYTVQHGAILGDFSKNWLDDAAWQALLELAETAGLKERIHQLHAGEVVNPAENRAAAHVLQRRTQTRPDIATWRRHFCQLADDYRNNHCLTAFGEPVEAVVNIGIGGSFLGPQLVIDALTRLQTDSHYPVHFLSSVDDSLLDSVFSQINPRRTLFCVSSKSLGTSETLRNTQAVMQRITSLTGYQPGTGRHSFVAATANTTAARELGIAESHVLPFAHSIGGRFSLWSSIGFPIVMAIGTDAFGQLLAGAESQDRHYASAPFDRNLPVIMALLSIWYRNFMGLPAYAVLPYDARLKHLPAWLQQLMMESVGKGRDLHGQELPYSTSPWVFGEHGQLSQHAFFQAFHQGNDVTPVDFIGVRQPATNNQRFLLVNMLAQSATLMNGTRDPDTSIHACCPGNRPSSVLLLDDLSPYSLGQLLALYENMVFTQSVIWNVNCFDQPGVELGKRMARRIDHHLQAGTLHNLDTDASTRALLETILSDHNVPTITKDP